MRIELGNLGKLHLWNCKRNNSLASFSSHKKLVKRKYGSERHMATRYNNMKTLQAKWKFVLNFNLLGTEVCNRKTNYKKLCKNCSQREYCMVSSISNVLQVIL